MANQKRNDKADGDEQPNGNEQPAENEKPTGEVRAAVRSPKVWAAVCPKNPAHKNTKVYKTDGRTRRCKCNDCGHTWPQIGEYADPLRNYCHHLAQEFDELVKEFDELVKAVEPNEFAGEVAVSITPESLRKIAAELRGLIT